MTEITSEAVKQAIISELLQIFPNTTVYKEARTNPLFPHFFVYQIDVSCQRERRYYNLLTYSMDVRYRIASDPSTNLRLQQDLDSVGFQLLHNFNHLAYRDTFIRCSEKSIEKQEGVLHFFFKVVILEKEINSNESIKQNRLGVKIDT